MQQLTLNQKEIPIQTYYQVIRKDLQDVNSRIINEKNENYFRNTKTQPDHSNFRLDFTLLDFLYNKIYPEKQKEQKNNSQQQQENNIYDYKQQQKYIDSNHKKSDPEKPKEQEHRSLQEIIVNYIQEHQQQKNQNNKQIYYKRDIKVFEDSQKILKEQIEEIQKNKFIDQIIQIFNKFYQGDSSQILLHNANWINKEDIMLYIKEAVLKFNLIPYKQTNDKDLKVTYLGVSGAFDTKSLVNEKNFQSFQSFSLVYSNQQKFIDKDCLQNLIRQDQYFVKLKLNNNNKIINEIQLLYRYFIKTKIKKFKPKIIVLLIEINDQFDFEIFFLQKILSQLEGISQHSLIAIPLLNQSSPLNYEKYLKSTIAIANAFLDYNYKRKCKAYYQCDEMSANQYQEYIQYFAQTQKEEQFYDLQYLSLKVRKSQYQSKSMEIEQEFKQQAQANFVNASENVIQQDNQQAKTFEFNIIGILNDKNQIELTKLFEKESKNPINISQVQYFISYDVDVQKEYFTICVVKGNQLFYDQFFYKTERKNQIDESIYLKLYRWEINKKLRSSFLLQGSLFYEFNVQFSREEEQKSKGSKFKYYVQVCKYDLLNIEKEPSIYKNYKEQNNYSLMNFTVTSIKQNKFIVLGGTFPSLNAENPFEFDIGTLSLTVEIFDVQDSALKVWTNGGKIKQYENSIAININDTSFLYFDAQTKYLAAPITSQIKRMTIFGQRNELKAENCKYINEQNFDFFQSKCKLFKSNNLNFKLIKQQKNINQLQFYLVVQEFVADNLKIINQQDIIDIQNLQKQLQLLSHMFYFTYDIYKQTLDIKVETCQFIIGQIEKQSSLQKACLYVNWLEDRKNQYIFHYNGHQNLYLLYFQDNPQKKMRKFTFEDTKEKEDNQDFDEVIFNDLENEQLWIVRKINHQNYISLDLFESDWINLQDVKDSVEDSITKVPMNFIYSINQINEDFCLIGLEVKWELEDDLRCPYLVVCTSTCIYQISIKLIRKQKWDNILNYKPNSWEREPLQFQQQAIHKQKQVEFNINMSIPAIVASLKNGDLLLFYTYCNVRKENEKLYELEIQYLILRDLNKRYYYDENQFEDKSREFQFKTIKYHSIEQVNAARINTVIIENNEFEFSIIVEESDSKLYKIFSGFQQKQYITVMKQCKILNGVAHGKNQCLIINPNNEFYQIE